MNPHNPFRSADFKSAASANFAIRAEESNQLHLKSTDAGLLRTDDHANDQDQRLGPRLLWVSIKDALALQPILRRARITTADHRLALTELPPRDQPHRPASRARHHSNIRVLGMAELGLIFQEENRSRVHLVGNPLIEELQVGHPALRESDVTKQVPFGASSS